MKTVAVVTVYCGILENVEVFTCSGDNSIISKGPYAGQHYVEAATERLIEKVKQANADAGNPELTEEEVDGLVENSRWEVGDYDFRLVFPTTHGD